MGSFTLCIDNETHVCSPNASWGAEIYVLHPFVHITREALLSLEKQKIIFANTCNLGCKDSVCIVLFLMPEFPLGDVLVHTYLSEFSIYYDTVNALICFDK